MKTAVLIPLFNHAGFIAAALDSVRAQTRAPECLLVVDDGSTDNSAAAVAAWLDAAPPGFRARVEFFPQRNLGAHAALNRLVALAAERGCEAAAILNSDDGFHPERLARGLAFLEANPGVSLLCTRLRLVDAAGRPLPADAERARWLDAAWAAGNVDRDPQTGGPDLPAWLGRVNFAATTSNFLARVDWLRAHSFPPLRLAHDYALLVRAALGGRLAVLGEELLDYRVHGANTINAAPEALVAEMLQLTADLARELAPRLVDGAEPATRAAYARWRRAGWENFSAFRADLFEVLAARALARLPAGEEPAALLAEPGLRADAAHLPNVALADARAHPAALAERVERLEGQFAKTLADRQALAELRRLHALLLGSRWFALGRLLGQVRALHRAGGKTPVEKLAVLRDRLPRSRWLRLGRSLRSHSCTKLLATDEHR